MNHAEFPFVDELPTSSEKSKAEKGCRPRLVSGAANPPCLLLEPFYLGTRKRAEPI
ncbi:hypothetical protein BofuT4_uP070050.1 [Botrytis cinerea T4]|uniref:Uncharacterized protein n=1 Tax=Botryotinia fuckeliana (strain T4) TaxID=999810 RepID=G2XQ41_BOTF4|nr:hypothetical protein BofuT4_uP070050.1 [Botrytis cinerea T4]